MKLKSLILPLLLFFANAGFGQVTVDVFINGIKAGQYVIKDGESTGGISYTKAVYKNMSRLSVQIKGNAVEGPYTRKMEVLGDGATLLLKTADETAGAVGQFVLTDKTVITRLKKGKEVTLFLEKTPSNTKSMEAIKRIYLGSFTRSK